jgi:phage gpG-like protein
MSETITQQVDKIQNAIALVPNRMIPMARRTLGEYGHKFLELFTKARLSGRQGTVGLNRRTGSLARSFNTNLIQDQNSATVTVWTTSPYARIHELGGDIKPVKKQWLTIPTDRMKTGAGAARAGSARDVVGLNFVMFQAGRPQLGKMEGGRWVTYFNLRKKVTIPARLEFQKQWKNNVPTAIGMLVKVSEQVLDESYQRI